MSQKSSFFSRFSIRTQILIGFVPVLLILGFLGASSQYKFDEFIGSFNQLSLSKQENNIFRDIERDSIELQRNVIVYSYFGYSGVLKKVEYLQKQLKENLDIVGNTIEPDGTIEKLYTQLIERYAIYEGSFENLKAKREKLREIEGIKLPSLDTQFLNTLNDLKARNFIENDVQAKLILILIENKQLKIKSNIKSFILFPDSSLYKDTIILADQTDGQIQTLKQLIGAGVEHQSIESLVGFFESYKATFLELINVNRTYLHLVNVVIAGQGVEIDRLARELQRLTNEKGESLKIKILQDTHSSKNNYFLLSLIAAIVGLGTMFLIALSISRPVRNMADTLSRIADGDAQAEIPGTDRGDEVGHMAKAANAFKLNEARLSSILTNMNDGLITMDDQGLVQTFNPACETIFGYKAQDVIGQNIKMLMPEPYHGEHDGYLDNYKTTGKKKIIGIGREVEGRRRNGSVFPMDLSVNEIFVDGKQLFSGVIRDISEAKAAALEIENARGFQDLVVNSIPDLLFVKDSEYKIVQANEAFINNYPPEKRDKVIGYTTLEEYPEEQVALFTANDRIALEEGYHEAQEDITFPDGSVRNLFTKKVGFDSNGKRFILGISRDITQMKKAEQEIMRSNEELERFAYIASHDLQEPLRMVSSFTELLNEEYADQMDEQAIQYMGFITDASQRMHHLVSDLLDYSRAGHDDAGASDFESRKRVDIAIQNLNEALEETKTRITIDDDLPIIRVNAIRFTRLMQNLIGNAIKYRAQDVTPEIHIGIQDDGDSWEFSIKDNGIGIKQDYLEQIFVLFKRLHNKSEYGGTGIGLSVCKKIVDSFEGKLWVESEYGKGSIFKFTIPKHDLRGE